MGCQKCDNLGYYYDREVYAGQHGELKLCSCVLKSCKCEGKRPYQYFDNRSEVQWCPCGPYRLRLKKVAQFFAASDVPQKYRWKFLIDFEEKAPDGTPLPGAPQLKQRVSSLCDAGETGRGFLVWGSPGNGKTLLSCIALNELILRYAKPGRFLDLSFKYFQKLRSTYNEESGVYGRTWEILEELSTIPFLVMDDFGVQRNTPWELEMLYNLVDTRYEEERVTMVTTNKDIGEIENLADGRIFSRLTEMCLMLHVEAPDYRIHLAGGPLKVDRIRSRGKK